MNAKLSEYRANKQKSLLESNHCKKSEENDTDNIKDPVDSDSNKPRLRKTKMTDSETKTTTRHVPIMPDVLMDTEPVETQNWKVVQVERILKIIIWCLLMALFIVIEFGIVFVVLSIFYLMYINLRTRPKKPGELSAYSVFNPHFETLNGTITAEQFERELIYGAVTPSAH